MHGENLRTRLHALTDTLTEELVQIYRETLGYIVQRTVLEVQSKPKSLVKAPRRGKLAVLRPARSGGYEMALPDGRLWHGTRARDLRRKARQRGVAWQESALYG